MIPHPSPFLCLYNTPSPIYIYLFCGGRLSWTVYQKIYMFHVERFVKKHDVPRHFTWCR
nr:MAG TPA: hypothetical protein [Crassvirales sp.]